jgi:hypothetical protein
MAHPERVVEDVELRSGDGGTTATEIESRATAGVRGARRRTAVVLPDETLVD